MIKSILYDLDGVLVDACEIHYEALNRALLDIAGFKIDRAEHELEYNGLPTLVKLEKLVHTGKFDKAKLKLTAFKEISDLKQKYTIELINDFAKIDKEKIELHEFITMTLGISIGCVTNSIKKTAQLMLERTGQLKYMNILVTNEDITEHKPRAEGYIQAMVRLSSLPKNTIIVEDSDVGIQAAFESCANVVRVRNAKEVTLENIMKYFREFNV